jgi:hypothetical protein
VVGGDDHVSGPPAMLNGHNVRFIGYDQLLILAASVVMRAAMSVDVVPGLRHVLVRHRGIRDVRL